MFYLIQFLSMRILRVFGMGMYVSVVRKNDFTVCLRLAGAN